MTMMRGGIDTDIDKRGGGCERGRGGVEESCDEA